MGVAHRPEYRDLVERALAEDRARTDITSDAIVPADRRAQGVFLAKQSVRRRRPGRRARDVSPGRSSLRFQPIVADGAPWHLVTRLAEIDGFARGILAAERTALNFLQHLSGIATLTRRFVDAARGRITILDTRKTVPTLRALAKYAVRCGGGTNHRIGLYDGVLIKDNHIRVAGGIAEAVRRVRERHRATPIEVEAQSLQQVDDALAAGADIIMLDNLDDARDGGGRAAHWRARARGDLRRHHAGAHPGAGGDRRRLRVGRRPHALGARGRHQPRSRSAVTFELIPDDLAGALAAHQARLGPFGHLHYVADIDSTNTARWRWRTRARPKAPRCWPAHSGPDAAGAGARGFRRRAPDCICR